MVTSVQTLETREDALVRLAAKARTDGIKLYRDRRDGRHYASSRSRPGQLHYVTAVSCTCEGFIHHQRCAHLGALLSALGWLELDTPEPTPPASSVKNLDTTPSCPVCHGTGTECGTVPSGRTWRYENVVCASCHGRGTAAAA